MTRRGSGSHDGLFLRTLTALLLPPGFRAEYGEEIRRAAARRADSAPPGRRAGLWAREVVDLGRTGVREWGAVLFGGGRGARDGGHQGREHRMEGLMGDLRFALRGLARARAFTAVVVLTLALGIGANAAIFSVVDAVLLQDLPYEEPDRIVAAWQDVTRRGGPAREWFNVEDYADLVAEPNLLEAAAWWGGWGPTLTGEGAPEVVDAAIVSHEMLDGVLRTRPHLGRLFMAEDDVPGAPGVVVLSHASWQRRFGADPQIVGRTITLQGLPFSVVGVTPPGFQTPVAREAELWVAPGFQGEQGCGRGCFGIRVLGRLAPGVPLETAAERARALATRLEQAYPETNTDLSFNLVGLRADLTRDASRPLWVLLGSVAFVLLIACTNVASLVVTRTAARSGELAVRAALGAGRSRILRHLLAESTLLAAAGGAAGLLLAWWGTGALVSLAPDGVVPRLEGVGLDGRVVAFAAGLTLLTAFLFGALPAWHGARGGLRSGLQAGGRGGAGGGRQRGRSALVVGQVALALVLLTGAGLMLRSLQRLSDAELGFEPEGVLTFVVSLPSAPYADAPSRQQFYGALLEGIRALPGVEGAGAVNALPLAGEDSDSDFLVEGEAPPPPGVPQAAWVRPVTDGYFGAMGMERLAGRDFGPGDAAGAPLVVMVNQTLADRYYGGDAVGRRIGFGGPDNPNWRTIVGVVRDVRHFGLREGERPAAYFPYGQVAFGRMTVAVKSSGDPETLTASVRATLAGLDPALAATGITPLEDRVGRALAPDRFLGVLLAVFAATALVLAAVGLYGVVAYGVERRRREMGIRLALGADGSRLRGMVLGAGLRLTGVGVAVGVLGAWFASRALTSLLFEVAPSDPLTFAVTVLVLGTTAVLASWLPALRASRSDPAEVLRAE